MKLYHQQCQGWSQRSQALAVRSKWYMAMV